MDTLKWVEEWYLSQCDGKWEHGYGIRISTLDNPGWAVAINLNGTALSAISLEYKMVEKDEEDWY